MTGATLIFLDANVFMYALGAEHQFRRPSIEVLDLATAHDEFYTNAEVFQEILHRYLFQRRWAQVKPSTEALFGVMEGRILEVVAQDVRDAGELALIHTNLQARDLVHLAIMHRVGCAHVVSADRAFEGVDGIERLDPLLVDEWAPRVTGV